jgi:hypothetical protein
MSSNHQSQPVVIGGNVGSLIDDFDMMGPMPTGPQTTTNNGGQRAPSAVPNLLDDELSSILGTDTNIGGAQTPQPSMPMMNTTTSLPVHQPAKSGNLLDDLFGDLNLGGGGSGLSYSNNSTFALPKEVRTKSDLYRNCINIF